MGMSTTANLDLLRGDLAAAEADLASVREKIGTESDFSAQATLQREENDLVDRISALQRALAAAQAEAEREEAQKREDLERDWAERLYPQAREELDGAEARTLSLLRQTREAFDCWDGVFAAWEATRRICGPDCKPLLGRFPRSFADWLSPNPFDPSPSAKERRHILR